MSENDALEKLKKLLRLSESANEHESNLAMEKAMALAAKHNIDISSLDANSPEKEGISHEKIWDDDRYPIRLKLIDGLLQAFFFVKVIYFPDGDVMLIGRKTDIDFAKWVRDFLAETFGRLAREARATDTTIQFVYDDYYMGLEKTLFVKLDEAKKKAEREEWERLCKERGGSAGQWADKYAITLQTDKKALETYVNDRWKTKPQQGIKRNMTNAYLKGIIDGEKININRPLASGGGKVVRELK